MKSYEARLSEIIEKLISLETKRSHVFKIRKGHIKLLTEKKKIISIIKKTQHHYMVRKTLDTRVYDRKMKSYTTRLSEIEEKIALNEARHEFKRRTKRHR
jgi:hypothetical protein